MSTPASIIVKVRPEDVGKRRKCDTSKINLRTRQMAAEMWKTFGHSDEEIDEILENTDKLPDMEFMNKTIKSVKLWPFVGAYNHWDGDPSGIGKELRKRYNDYKSALNLVLAGNYSTILDGSVPYAALPKRIDIDAVWKQCKPIVADELGDCHINFEYLFDNGRWYYRAYGEKKFKVLK